MHPFPTIFDHFPSHELFPMMTSNNFNTGQSLHWTSHSSQPGGNVVSIKNNFDEIINPFLNLESKQQKIENSNTPPNKERNVKKEEQDDDSLKLKSFYCFQFFC